ncbi:hypothetical protein D3C72_1597680 [compost metagenome]
MYARTMVRAATTYCSRSFVIICAGSKAKSRVYGFSLCVSMRAVNTRRQVSDVMRRLLPVAMNSARFGSVTVSLLPKIRSAKVGAVRNASSDAEPSGSRTLSQSTTRCPSRSTANRRLRVSSSVSAGGRIAGSEPIARIPIQRASKVLPLPAAGASKPMPGAVGKLARNAADSRPCSTTPRATSSTNGNKASGRHRKRSAASASAGVGLLGTFGGFGCSL